MKIFDKFYTAINATPFSEKGRERLSDLGRDVSNLSILRREFYENIYVHPFSTFDEMSEAFKEKSEETLVFGKNKEHLETLIKRKNDFETDTKNNKEVIFMIIGPAGSGKTTYLNWLFDNVLNQADQQKLIIIDIENKSEVRNVVRLCDDDYDLKNKFYTLSGRLSSAILYVINKCLIPSPKESINNYKKRLSNICKNHEKMFRFNNAPGEAPLIKRFFTFIKEYACSNQESEYFTQLLFTLLDDIEKQSSKEKMDLYFQILIKFMLCQSSSENTLRRKSYVIAIDNIERLLDEDSEEAVIVQENELKEFVNAIKNSIDAIDGILEIKGYHLKNKLSIILSLRDTTIKLVSARHNVDDGNYPLNITDWYDMQIIYDNKFRMYLSDKDKELLIKDPAYKTFDSIMRDKTKSSGLYYTILNMYNHDIRRITEAMEQIIGLSVNTNFVFNDYLYWWECSFKKEATNTKITTLRFLCRKAVLRVFYNLFEHQGVFNRLGVGTPLQLEKKSSYARKILTYLYQKNNIKKYDEQENYFSLYDLVCTILKPSNARGYNSINDFDLNNFANILFQMINISMLPNFWSPLVSLILSNRAETDGKAIYETLKNASECIESKIKITDAGRAFVLLNVDFEYFSCRYNYENRTPLLCSGNLKRAKDGEYECIKAIRKVRIHTTECIDILINHDLSQFPNTINSSVCERMGDLLFDGIPHPVRILRQHINYLQNYKFFVENYANINEVNKKEICDGKSDEIAIELRKGFLCVDCKSGKLFITSNEDKNCQRCKKGELYSDYKYIKPCIMWEIDEYKKIINDVLFKDSGRSPKYFSNDYSKIHMWLGTTHDE
jgi:GTPase SAR1 family protein